MKKLTAAKAKEAYEKMNDIRNFENTLHDIFAKGEIGRAHV